MGEQPTGPTLKEELDALNLSPRERRAFVQYLLATSPASVVADLYFALRDPAERLPQSPQQWRDAYHFATTRTSAADAPGTRGPHRRELSTEYLRSILEAVGEEYEREARELGLAPPPFHHGPFRYERHADAPTLPEWRRDIDEGDPVQRMIAIGCHALDQLFATLDEVDARDIVEMAPSAGDSPGDVLAIVATTLQVFAPLLAGPGRTTPLRAGLREAARLSARGGPRSSSVKRERKLMLAQLVENRRAARERAAQRGGDASTFRAPVSRDSGSPWTLDEVRGAARDVAKMVLNENSTDTRSLQDTTKRLVKNIQRAGLVRPPAGPSSRKSAQS